MIQLADHLILMLKTTKTNRQLVGHHHPTMVVFHHEINAWQIVKQLLQLSCAQLINKFLCVFGHANINYKTGGGPAGLPVCLTIGYLGFQVGCCWLSQILIFLDNWAAILGLSAIRLLSSPISSLML